MDLVLERADQCINLIEMKYYGDTFTITKDYAELLRRKKQRFIEHNGLRKAVFLTLLTTYGATENSYYHELVTNQIHLDDLFT